MTSQAKTKSYEFVSNEFIKRYETGGNDSILNEQGRDGSGHDLIMALYIVDKKKHYNNTKK